MSGEHGRDADPDRGTVGPFVPLSGDSILHALTEPRGTGAAGADHEATPSHDGRYEVLGEVARGGLGIVLRTRDDNLGREVAMKVLRPEFSREPEVLRRFVEEAQIGGQLQHPGIVPVYEMGLQSDRRAYFTMKYIRGRTLTVLLRDREVLTEDRPPFTRLSPHRKASDPRIRRGGQMGGQRPFSALLRLSQPT